MDKRVFFPFAASSLMGSAEQRRRILDWLSPGRFDERYDKFCDVRVQMSGTWFLKSYEFDKWMKGLSNLFIVTGMGIILAHVFMLISEAGAGKSHLMYVSAL